MKLVQSTLERNFIIEHRGKKFYVNYQNSSGFITKLLNRFNWEIIDENQEELNIFEFENMNNKEKIQIQKNKELRGSLIGFCIKHFYDFSPELKDDF